MKTAVGHLHSFGLRQSRGERSHAADRRTTFKLVLEMLEDRITPTTFVVTDTSDSPLDANSLRYAVNNATNNDSITFSLPAASVIMVSSPLEITTNIAIVGPGAADLAVDGGGSVQVFNIASGASVNMSGLTVQNGNASSGGGIFNAGFLTLSDATVSNNSASWGGGIANQGTLTLNNDSVCWNWDSEGDGGGDIDNASGATLNAANSNAFTSYTNLYNDGTLDLGGNSNTVGSLMGAGIINSSVATTLTVTGGGFFTGSIQDGPGTVALSVAGNSQTLILAGNDTYSGLTTINAGNTLQAGSNAALSANSQVDDLGSLDLAGYDSSIGALSGSGTVTNNLAAATLTVTGGGCFSGNIQDGNGGNTIALTLAGAGKTLTLSGNNTFSGLTTINTGDILKVGSSTALTGNTSVTVNGTLNLNHNSIDIMALNGSASGTVLNTGTTGTLTVNGGGLFAGSITGDHTALTIAPSTLILLGANNYGGVTIINFGDTLMANSTSAFSASSDITDNGTLDLGGFDNSIGALNGNGVVTSSNADATLSVTGGGFFTGTIEDDGAIGLTVAGTSQTLTLSGANTYSGQTTVNASDTLLVDGSETSPVSVAGTLGGTGTTGDLTVAGGAVNPGDPVGSVGTLYANSADFSNGGALDVEITGGSPANDLLSVAGGVTLGGTSTLNIDLNGLNSTGTFTIITDGSQTGQFTNVNVVNNVNGYVVTVAYTGNAVTVTVALAPLQPPSITSVVINQDRTALNNAPGQSTPGQQRSMVNDIVYTFSEPVNILNFSADPNVFVINALTVNGVTGTVPTLSWAPVAGSNNTEWAVTFSGAGVTGGSIANGCYDITIQNPQSITAVADSQQLSLASSGIGGATQAFFRLFGDIDGNKVVNAFDNANFKPALTNYNAAFDYDQNGFVNAIDGVHFRNDLGVSFTGFTATI
jgi:autotransporter-associated beta strand protein